MPATGAVEAGVGPVVGLGHGRSAGIAAALSAAENVAPRKLEPKKIQDALVAMGVDLFARVE